MKKIIDFVGGASGRSATGYIRTKCKRTGAENLVNTKFQMRVSSYDDQGNMVVQYAEKGKYEVYLKNTSTEKTTSFVLMENCFMHNRFVAGSVASASASLVLLCVFWLFSLRKNRDIHIAVRVFASIMTIGWILNCIWWTLLGFQTIGYY